MAALREHAFAGTIVEQHGVDVPRAWISLLTWTPCFPCAFAWLYSPAFEEQQRAAIRAQTVALTRSGVRMTLPKFHVCRASACLDLQGPLGCMPCLGLILSTTSHTNPDVPTSAEPPILRTITVPYDCVVRCVVHKLGAAGGPPCNRVQHPGLSLVSIVCAAGRGERASPTISIVGLSAPHDFVEDVLSMKQHGQLPPRRPGGGPLAAIEEWWRTLVGVGGVPPGESGDAAAAAAVTAGAPSDDFETCAKQIEHVQHLSDQHKLTLYGLYKQATVGDAPQHAPQAWQLLPRAKWHAWQNHRGMAIAEARRRYVLAVQGMLGQRSRGTESLV